jgi:hypothetical protein
MLQSLFFIIKIKVKIETCKVDIQHLNSLVLKSKSKDYIETNKLNFLFCKRIDILINIAENARLVL